MDRKDSEKRRQGPKIQFTQLTTDDCVGHEEDIKYCNGLGYVQMHIPERRNQMLRRFEDEFGDDK